MGLGGTGLLKRAKQLELQGSQKIRFTPSCKSALDELLHDIYIIQCPRPSDYHHRRELIRIFNVIAKETYGNNRSDFPIVEPFGSFSMDMFSAGSDLDLSINFSNDTTEFPRDKKIQALRKFAKVLYTFQRRGHVSGVQSIMRARVPIVKVVDHGTGVECDISVDNKHGIAKSQIIHIISAIDERFHKLSFLMKAWAKAHDVNSSKDHTLNSLSIISLVAFHLQTREPPILPPFCDLLKDGTDPATVMKVTHGFLHYGKRNKESLAELFFTLLTKLASVETLWPEGLCVSTYEGSWISKTWDSQVGYINVEDFSDPSQNVARSVGMEGVQKIYKCIQSSLQNLSAFVDNRVQAPKLKRLLFGPECIPIGNNAVVNPKRDFPFHDPAALPPPLGPIPAKKVRLGEGWGVHQVHGETPRNLLPVTPPVHLQQPPFVAPKFGYGLQQMPTGSARSHPECIPIGNNDVVNPKRDFTFHDPAALPPPLGPIPAKKMWLAEGWGVHQVHGETPRNLLPVTPPIHLQQPPFVAPKFSYGLQMPTGSARSHGPPLQIPFAPPLYGKGLHQSPVGFEGSQSMNPMHSMPYSELGHVPNAQAYIYHAPR